MPPALLRRWHETPRLPVPVVGLVVVQTVLVLGYTWALWVLAGVPDEQKSLTITSIYAPIEVIAAVLLWLAARTAEDATRRGWTLVAAAMTCSALVNLEWVWASIDPSHQFRWPSFAIVYAQYPLTLWALASFPTAGGSDVDRRKYLLDSAIVLTASGVLAWHFLFRDLVSGNDATPLLTLRAVAYTAFCLTVLSSALTLFVRRPARPLVVPLALLTAAWAAWTLANMLQMRATVRGTSLNEITFNVCFAAGAWLVTLAACACLSRVRSRPRTVGDERTVAAAPSCSLLPYAAIASVFGVLLLQARLAAGEPSAASAGPLQALVAGAIAITGAVVVRQILAQRGTAALVAQRLRQEAHFRALVQHASDVILVVDAEGVVREASPSVAHTLGYPAESLLGRPLTELVSADDRALVRADLAEIVAAGDTVGRPSAPCEWRVSRPGGEVRWLEVLCTNLLHDSAVAGIVVNGRDVSERKALEAELTRQAYHDPLTGLVNRARFRDIVEQALAGHRADDGADDRTSVAVLYIDLDGFKPVNDTLGHDAGDRVLSVVTERLRDATRGSDVVARLGGDEFAILLEHVRDIDEAAAVARRVLTRVQQPITAERAIVHVGASIGIACTAIGGEGSAEYALTCEALLRDADEAMYAAKAQGGRRYVIYAPRVARRENER